MGATIIKVRNTWIIGDRMLEITAPRMLFVDIETLPNQGFTWGLYDQNVIEFTQQSCLATWVAKWAGDK